jgi:hypothetical protein
MTKQSFNDHNSAPKLMSDNENSVARRVTLEDKPMVHNILPHYVGYTDLTISYHGMIATNLSENIALGIYSHRAHRAALAHIDQTTGFASVLRIIYKVRHDKDDILDIYITGGNDSSRDKFAPLKKALTNLPKTQIIMNNSFPKNKTAEDVQHLGINAHGLYHKNVESLWYCKINPKQSPQAENNSIFCKMGGTYPIIEIDYSSPEFEQLVIGDHHHIL